MTSEFGKIDWSAYYAKEGEVYAHREDADTLQPVQGGVAGLSAQTCGPTRTSAAARASCRHWIAGRMWLDRVVGADLSAARLERSRQKYPDVEFVQGDVAKLPFTDRQFKNVVSCVGTLEHQEQPEKALAELARVSRRYVLVMVPDRQEVEKTLCPHCLKVFPARGHIQSFDIARLRESRTGRA